MTIDVREGGERLPLGQRPLLPGSPGSPPHPPSRKIAYGALGILVGLTGALGNAMVTVNLPQLQGALGLYSYEIAWLPTAYAMTYVTSSLLLIKLRIAFGLRPFALIFTATYMIATLAHLFVGGFAMAIVVRGASGVAAAALNTLTIYYIMQAAPARWRIKSIAFGLGIPQLAIPLARLFSTDLLGLGEWQALYCFELGLAMISFAAVMLMPLPPSERSHTFEKLDFLTFPLLAIGCALLCAVLGLGRTLWWTDVPWLGWALAASLPLIAAALMIEHGRNKPLLVTRWLGTADILRFIVVTIMFKIVSSEQTSGAVGLLNALGLNNDQLHPLFLIVLVATFLGCIAAAIMINLESTVPPIILALSVTAVACFLDYGASSQTRAPQFYLTQGLIAFSGTLFLGPSLLFGLVRALSKGTSHIISLVGMFGLLQTLGGLAGSALIGTFANLREKAHFGVIADRLTLSDPLVSQRIQGTGAALGKVISDPSFRAAEGVAALGRQATLEATVLAYDDVFLLIGILALATALYLAYVMSARKLRARFAAPIQLRGAPA